MGAGLALDLALSLDPCLLAEVAGLAELDDWQVAALRTRAPRCLWNAARQAGKSTLAAVLAVHQVLYSPASLVLVVSPTERQSKEVFKKALDVYAATGRQVPAESETRLWLELGNKSRLLSLPGTAGTVRGYSAPALIILDEAAHVDDGMVEVLLPMLVRSPAGRLLALSTPAGKRGWWHSAWVDGGAAWERLLVTADACPRLTRAALDAQRQVLMSEAKYRQEFYGEFLEVDDAVFRFEDVHGALDDSVEPLFPETTSVDWSTEVGVNGHAHVH
jgi:hypothetical protein